MAAHDARPRPGAVRRVPGGPRRRRRRSWPRKPRRRAARRGRRDRPRPCAPTASTPSAGSPPRRSSTLQRILGARDRRAGCTSGRTASTRRPSPRTPPPAPWRRRTPLRPRRTGPGRRRRALLAARRRSSASGCATSGQVAGPLTLTVRYADRSATTRTRTLAEPTAHSPALTAAAYALHDALGLQRARVRCVALRAEELTGAELASRQLSFDRRGRAGRAGSRRPPTGRGPASGRVRGPARRRLPARTGCPRTSRKS